MSDATPITPDVTTVLSVAYRALTCLHIATESSVADDVCAKVHAAFRALQSEVARLKVQVVTQIEPLCATSYQIGMEVRTALDQLSGAASDYTAKQAALLVSASKLALARQVVAVMLRDLEAAVAFADHDGTVSASPRGDLVETAAAPRAMAVRE